jgi:hypothetical protein
VDSKRPGAVGRLVILSVDIALRHDSLFGLCGLKRAGERVQIIHPRFKGLCVSGWDRRSRRSVRRRATLGSF